MTGQSVKTATGRLAGFENTSNRSGGTQLPHGGL